MFPFYDNPRETVMEEVRYLFEEKKPQIIVRREESLFVHEVFVEENEFITSYVEQHYKLIKKIDKAFIYQRTD